MTPQVKRKIHIADYSTDWPTLFEKEKALVQKTIGDVQIEHTGSTSIDGLGAKPVIDMMGVVHHLDDALQYVEKMETLGYKYIPELEEQLPDRKFFQKRADDVPVCHISFTEKDSDFYTRQILFRDYMRNHPESVREYEKIKRELAKEHVDNFDTYNAGKTAFILTIIEAARKEGYGIKMEPILFAISAHADQKYGEYPYVVHLGFVNHYVNKYKHLLSNQNEIDVATASGWLHDTMEDCPAVTYEKIKEKFGENIANTVQALTNVGGVYNLAELKNNRVAFFVKLCDRLANVSFFRINFKEKAYNKYADQFDEIFNNYPEEFKEMAGELKSLLSLHSEQDQLHLHLDK